MIGALEAILARGATTAEGLPFSRTRDALADYCRGPRYLAGLLAAAVRVDLDGNAAGEITEHQRELARVALERLERRREAERQGKRPIAWRVYVPPRLRRQPLPLRRLPHPEHPR